MTQPDQEIQSWTAQFLEVTLSRTWTGNGNHPWWLISYNEWRAHDALGGLSPVEFRVQTEVENPTFELST